MTFEQLVMERVNELLRYRRWHLTNRRLIDWPDLRHDDRVELRALIRLVKRWRRIEAARPDPIDHAKAYAEWFVDWTETERRIAAGNR